MTSAITEEQKPIPQLTPTETAIPDPEEPIAGTVFDLQNCVRDSSHAQFCRPTAASLCARVTASQSLHLRDQTNERARVLAYLKNGEQVRVIEFGKWWKIETSQGTGFANAKYLELTECRQ